MSMVYSNGDGCCLFNGPGKTDSPPSSQPNGSNKSRNRGNSTRALLKSLNFFFIESFHRFFSIINRIHIDSVDLVTSYATLTKTDLVQNFHICGAMLLAT